MQFWNIPWNIDRLASIAEAAFQNIPDFHLDGLPVGVMSALADYIRAALMLKFNKRTVG